MHARAPAPSRVSNFQISHTHTHMKSTQTIHVIHKHAQKITHINTHTRKHRIAMHIVGKYRLGNAKETEVTACCAFCWTAVSAVCGLRLLVYVALSY